MHTDEFLFLNEDIDLLEAVNLNTDLILYEENFYLESFGLNLGFFNKDKLNDEKYVKSLIERINNIEVVENTAVDIYKLLVKVEQILLSITIIGIPVALLVGAISKLWVKIYNKLIDISSISGSQTMIKCIDKAINDLESQKKDATQSDKTKIENIIKSLKNNKAIIEKDIEKRKKDAKEGNRKKL